MARLEPTNGDQLVEAVQSALADNRRLEILGLGSKRGIGRPVEADDELVTAGLSGILAYDPAELVMTARAGTKFSEVEAALTEARQHFAFEPFRPAALFGTQDQTLGGILGAGLAGPRRLQAGSVRDHVLGFAGVSGRGEMFKAGGKVVKNVTGFDLSKVMAGSWGTLAVISELTFKVLPVPETEATVAVSGLSDAEAAAFLARATGSSAEVSGAAISEGRALVRLEGIASSVDYRAGVVQALTDAAVEVLDRDASRAVWSALRDAAGFADRPGVVWRVSCIPTQGPKLVEALRAEFEVEAIYDWQGGLVWLRIAGDDPKASRLRALLAEVGGGHATLIRAPEPVRLATHCFQPPEPGVAALSTRLSAAFDPMGILNPGRMG